MFSQASVRPHLWGGEGGESPHLANWGVPPSQVSMGEVPNPRSEQGGTSFPGQDGGGGGVCVPHCRSEWRVPPSQVRMGGNAGYPIPGQNGGYSLPRSGLGVPPSQIRMGEGTESRSGRGGYPPSAGWGVTLSAGWGTHSCPGPRSGQGGTPNWNSMTCTCYAVGGMPLAFTQEDFLV